MTDAQFAQIIARLDRVEGRLGNVETRLGEVETGLAELARLLDNLLDRIIAVEGVA